MKIAAFGRTQWLYYSIRAITAAGHSISLVGTCPAAPEYSVSEHDFALLAEELECPFFCDLSINSPEYVKLARESGAEAAISVNWLTIIGPEMLSQFRLGIINAHAGDLPRYRGNAVPNWAILAGEEKVTLTLHQMSIGLDAGPVLLKRDFPISEDTYIGDIYRFLDTAIPEAFVEAVNGLASGTIVPHPQPADTLLSLRCFPRRPVDGRVDWRDSAVSIARQVRASADPFAGAYTFFGEDRLTIWRARPASLAYPYLGVPGQVAERSRATGEVSVLTGDGILVLQEVELAGGGRKPAATVISSTRGRLGLDLEEHLAALKRRLAALEGGRG